MMLMMLLVAAVEAEECCRCITWLVYMRVSLGVRRSADFDRILSLVSIRIVVKSRSPAVSGQFPTPAP